MSTVSQDHNVAIEPFLADQIEVLKGPSTLLYGTGAIGGVVNVVDGRIAEKPLDETVSGRAELRADSVNDGVTGMMRADAMGADGALVLHADGVYRNQKDYDTPDGKQPNSFIDTKTGALGASLVGDAGFLGFSAARYEDRYGNPGEPGDLANGERGVFIDMLQNRFELKGGVNQPFGVFDSLRASVAHTDYEHTEFEGEEVGTRFLNEATEGRLELTHKPWAGWIGAFGAQVNDREFQAIGEEAFVPRTQTRSGGVFVTEQKKWNAFQLDLGARVDKIESNPDGLDDRSFTPLSLSAGALWNFNDAWRLSLQPRPRRARAGRRGTVRQRSAYRHGVVRDRQCRPRQGARQPGRTRLALPRQALRGEGRRVSDQLRRLHLSRRQRRLRPGRTRRGSVADPAVDAGRCQVPRFRGRGITHLVDNEAGQLDLRVFGDRVRATLDEGGNLPRIAPARVGADLRWDANAWRASLGAVRYDKQDDVAVGETPTDGYTLVDAHFAYHWDTSESLGWELFLDGNNLTDQVGRVHTSFLKDVVVLPGRNVSAGIRVFF